MSAKEIKNILNEADVLVEDPRFYSRVYACLSKAKRKERAKLGDRAKEVISADFEELSERLDESGLQESCSVRNVLITRELSDVLIDDHGKLNLGLIPEIISYLKAHMYSLGPDRQYDSKRNEHLLRVLTLLQENGQFARQIQMIAKPQMHRYAEEVIRDTLQLPTKTVITDAHARKAALSAWMCYLRQNVGSCFATAPAIIVHTEQPAVFLKDIQELFGTGRLKRTFGGVEYAVPFSYSWGAGDLRRVYLFQKGEVQEDLNIWKSPGLISALEQVGIIDRTLSTVEKNKKCKKLVIAAINSWDNKKEWFFATVEAVLRKVLLIHLELTESDVKEYERRPRGMIHGSLLMTAAASESDKGGKGGQCSRFLQEFEEAKNAFKILADNALLKTWEFTLASFAETKSQFTTWNLYSSLGLKPEDKGGIGPRLYEILKRRLDECNQKVQDLQFEYEQAYNHIQYLQRRIRSAASEDEARWIKIEYQTKSSEFYSLEEMRNTFHNKARRYAHLYDGLIDLYFRLLPNYFQEIFDPDIVDVAPGPYDDSPAGFRLVFKHGRSNTAQWSRIHNHIEFVEALANFFIATESELAHAPEMKGLEEDLAEIITSIVSHVRSKEFIETAFWRMAAAHNAPLIKDPLENLDKIEKKPWVYTSGGALSTLVSCYFRLDHKPTEVSRWVENPTELLVLLIDTVKEMPQKALEEAENNREKSLLVHSPTHAFLLKPGYSRFLEAWKSKQFTYTWVRDEVVQPLELFVSKIYVDDERMRYIIENLLPLIPKNNRHYFKQSFEKLGGSMQITDFRQHILDTIELSRGLQYAGRGVLSSPQLDSALYSLLPLFPSYKLKERVQTILSQLPAVPSKVKDQLLETLEEITGRVGSEKTISAKGLQDIVKAMLALVSWKTAGEIDYPLLVSQIAQKEGYAMPAPFLFSDTNWVKDHFAFLASPGSGKFELWRVDYTGSVGAPMTEWKQWLDGSRKKPDWGVYNRPHEYSL